jgi:hypothetical protein
MRQAVSILIGLGISIVSGSQASASPLSFDVFAQGNSSTSGTPLLTGITLTSGDLLVVSAAVDDCWSAGAADRETNASGLVGHTTNACRPLAPTDYGLWTQFGVSFPFASLVGQIGGGTPFLIGTSFNSIVSSSGQLALMFWDSNNGDNFGSVTATVDVNPAPSVPEPATIFLTGAGIATLLARRRATR